MEVHWVLWKEEKTQQGWFLEGCSDRRRKHIKRRERGRERDVGLK